MSDSLLLDFHMSLASFLCSALAVAYTFAWPIYLSSALDSCSKHGISALLGIEFMCPTFLNMLTI